VCTVKAVTRKPIIRQYELVEKLKKHNPNTDEDLVNKAYVFCMKVHGQQFRESGDPYFHHPLEVANILADMRLDHYYIVTALLHDTIEDTLTTYEEIENLFGTEIATLVNGVTKLSQLELQSSASPQAENFRKLFLAMSNDLRVLLVKLADRVHNMRTLHFVKDTEKRLRIAQETLEIYAPLASRIGITKFRDELQNYAFEHLHPEDYENVVMQLANMPQTQQLIENINADITKVLENGGLKVQVFGREKTPYSIWKKIQKRNITFEQLSDLMAFRIIVTNLQECYQALGLIHSSYIMVPGRFKDYISTPKANGYQSLHTTLIGPYNQKIEIQIRTQKMHEICEFGVAAHWHYKQKVSSKNSINLHEGKQYSWVRNILEILEHADNPDEFLEHTKLEMFNDQVFCFTPKGEVIALPKHASVLDFAYAIHGEIGNKAVSAKINGKQVPLRTELYNGDQIEIITSKQQEPSPSWEKYVITGKAKAQIRKFIRTKKSDQFLELGRTLLTRALQKEDCIFNEKTITQNLRGSHYNSYEDILISIGEGTLNVRDVIKYFKPQPTATNDDKIIKIKPLKAVENFENVPIQGLIPGMKIHYAGCCHPIPGDRINGVINTGKGITIHMQNCKQLASINKDGEFINLIWNNNDSNNVFTSRLQITFNNKQGALALITSTISKCKADINNLKIVTRNSDFWEILTDIGVHDRDQLRNIQAHLRSLNIVCQVNRQ
jgi:guanosine-3',5'-bis(diphosphate) 3'-pyrophosphohydrolase